MAIAFISTSKKPKRKLSIWIVFLLYLLSTLWGVLMSAIPVQAFTSVDSFCRQNPVACSQLMSSSIEDNLTTIAINTLRKAKSATALFRNLIGSYRLSELTSQGSQLLLNKIAENWCTINSTNMQSCLGFLTGSASTVVIAQTDGWGERFIATGFMGLSEYRNRIVSGLYLMRKPDGGVMGARAITPLGLWGGMSGYPFTGEFRQIWTFSVAVKPECNILYSNGVFSACGLSLDLDQMIQGLRAWGNGFTDFMSNLNNFTTTEDPTKTDPTPIPIFEEMSDGTTAYRGPGVRTCPPPTTWPFPGIVPWCPNTPDPTPDPTPSTTISTTLEPPLPPSTTISTSTEPSTTISTSTEPSTTISTSTEPSTTISTSTEPSMSNPISNPPEPSTTTSTEPSISTAPSTTNPPISNPVSNPPISNPVSNPVSNPPISNPVSNPPISNPVSNPVSNPPISTPDPSTTASQSTSQSIEPSSTLSISLTPPPTIEISNPDLSNKPSTSSSQTITPSIEPSQSTSISTSISQWISNTLLPSLSTSSSQSVEPSQSTTNIINPSISTSLSESIEPSQSVSQSLQPSVSQSIAPSQSTSTSVSQSIEPSQSTSTSIEPSASSSISVSTSNPIVPSFTIEPSTSLSVIPSPSIEPSTTVTPTVSVSITPSISTSIEPSITPSVSCEPSGSNTTTSILYLPGGDRAGWDGVNYVRYRITGDGCTEVIEAQIDPVTAPDPTDVTPTPLPEVTFTRTNFLSYAVTKFSTKFPFGIMGDTSVAGSNACPSWTFLGVQLTLCIVRDAVAILKYPTIIAFLIRTYRHV